MRISAVDRSLHGPYDRFVRTQPDALLYHSRAYLDLLCEMLDADDRSLVALDQTGEVVGALPAISMEGPAGTVLNSLPFYGSHGGILATQPAVAEHLLAAFTSLAGSPACASATVVENLRERWSYAALGASLGDDRIGQVSPIGHAADHEAGLMESFHYKTRNMVRKGQRSGFDVAIDNGAFELLEQMHSENLAALGGIAKPARFFELVDKHFAADADFRIYTAHKNGAPAAALLLFYFGATVEYFVPATRVEFRDLQPLSLLIFEAMSDASMRGFHWWNWGGTWKTQDGVYRFKKRWGTHDLLYRYHTRINRTDLLEWPRGKILAAYPYFYVAPFAALITPPEAP